MRFSTSELAAGLGAGLELGQTDTLSFIGVVIALHLVRKSSKLFCLDVRVELDIQGALPVSIAPPAWAKDNIQVNTILPGSIDTAMTKPMQANAEFHARVMARTAAGRLGTPDDASGRGAPTFALLKSIGRPLPEETTIGVDFGYSTCVFAIPEDAPTDWKGVMTFGGQAPQSSRGALLYPLEGNRWMLGLGGRHGEEPPGDTEGFLAFARELRTPTIYNAIRHAKRLGGVVRYGFPESVLRHFERLDTFPRGLLPIADAICRFNPAYGQGMSVAAQEACLLRKLLERLAEDSDPIAGLAPAFFAEVPALLDTPWSVATFDFINPNTRGQRPADFETRLKFRMALTRLAAEDPAVHLLTAEVQNLLKPRSVYRDDPALMQRVLAIMAQV
jgi:hypothetical protein